MPLERGKVAAPIIKLSWLVRAVLVRNHHVQLMKDNDGWTIERTAAELGRSVGSVSQDITIAQWAGTHEKTLRKFRTAKDALDWIKEKKKEMLSKEIELD